ncbi:MAG: hypothetical protein Q8O89_01750 [Nanoarchaeota archaeon]|nr:hypothetical protein [Nanoarchaeota archaeon]
MMKLIKIIKTTYNALYIYRAGKKVFVFKPSKNVEKEILANKLAKILGIKTLKMEPYEIDGVKGIKMNYATRSVLLANHKQELNKAHMRALKNIILFDIWIGNKDRHTANIFVGKELIAFDHEKIFNKGRARQFIKLDVGRRLNDNFVDVVEKLIDKRLSAKEVLIKLGFDEEDFPVIRKDDIKNVVKDEGLLEFLYSRTDFSKIEF